MSLDKGEGGCCRFTCSSLVTIKDVGVQLDVMLIKDNSLFQLGEDVKR